MTWETIPRMGTSRDNRPLVALVRIASKARHPEIAIRLSQEALGALGAKIGDCLHVARGHGPDDGWLRISKDGADGFRLRGRGNRRARPWIGFAAWPECGKDPRRAEPVAWAKVGDGVIKLKLPGWAVFATRFREKAA